jgi:hypothetical protein
MRATTIEESATQIELTALIEDERVAAELRTHQSGEVGVAYLNVAFLGQITGLKLVRVGDEQRAHVSIQRSASDYGTSMEPSFNNRSADEIAQIRARRILLDEELERSSRASVSDTLNDDTLEVFVRGTSTIIKAKRSPLPLIYEPDEAARKPEEFLRYARLVAILFLRLSGAIETIDKLALTIHADDQLEVDFVGRRARKYANREPYVMAVRGTLDLPARKAHSASDD